MVVLHQHVWMSRMIHHNFNNQLSSRKRGEGGDIIYYSLLFICYAMVEATNVEDTGGELLLLLIGDV